MKDAGDGMPFVEVDTRSQVNKERNLPGVESMTPGEKQEKNLEWRVRGFIKFANALNLPDGNGE
jgi:hypothetical protein